MLTILNSSVRIPARALVTESSGSPPAWRGLHTTVELVHPVNAFRLTTGPMGAAGEWYALGDGGGGGAESDDPHAADTDQPAGYDTMVTLPRGTVLNVGLVSPVDPDGDEEVYGELIRGPVSKVRPLDGWWGPRSG